MSHLKLLSVAWWKRGTGLSTQTAFWWSKLYQNSEPSISLGANLTEFWLTCSQTPRAFDVSAGNIALGKRVCSTDM